MRGLLLAALVALAPAAADAAERGKASWYGHPYHGRAMANGRIYNMNDPRVVAHKTLPLGTVVRVTNLSNHKSLVAKVEDRGPFVRGRVVDVSRAGGRRLGLLEAGVAPVRVQVVRRAPRHG